MSDGNGDDGPRARKSPGAYRTISEVADELQVPQHVLRFWETKFPQVRPLKRGGGRRYYRPEDIAVLRRISDLLYVQGYTIKGVQRLLSEGETVAGSVAAPPPEMDAPALAHGSEDLPAESRPQLALPGIGTGGSDPVVAKPVVRVRAESSVSVQPAVAPHAAAPQDTDLAPALAAAETELARLRALLAETAGELRTVRALLDEVITYP